MGNKQSAPCAGKDMFRATEGCHNPLTAARVPARDKPCTYVPDIYEAGFCDCTDDIPRHLHCGKSKQSCQVLCKRKPSGVIHLAQGTASAAHAHPTDHAKDATNDATKDGASDPASVKWIHTHMRLVISVSVVVLLALVVHVTRPVQNERKRLARLVAFQKRQDAIEASFDRQGRRGISG